jgi:hypothetical protein
MKRKLTTIIEGREVILATGPKTQTLNIRSNSDSKVGFETKIRMSGERFVTEAEFNAFGDLSRFKLLAMLLAPPYNGKIEFQDFEPWSAAWKQLRELQGSRCDRDEVIEIWKKRKLKSTDWLRAEKNFTGELFSYRHENMDKTGEKEIEKLLFPEGKDVKRTKGKPITIYFDGKTMGPLEATYQQSPLANQSKGQVIADAVARVKICKKLRPLMIEVKVGANNPWYALIECLQQVHLARTYPDIKRICPGTDLKGVWGMVLAPRSYFDAEKNQSFMKACTDLLNQLKSDTHARIAFASSDRLQNDNAIEIQPTQNWFPAAD